MRWGRQVVAMVLIGLMVHGIQVNYGRYREMQEICRQIELPSSARERSPDLLTGRDPNDRDPNPLSIAELAIDPTSERPVTHADYTFPMVDSDPKALSPQSFSPQSFSAMPEAGEPGTSDRDSESESESDRASADRGMASEPLVDEIMDIRRRLGGSAVASILGSGDGATENGTIEEFRSALLDLSVRRYEQAEIAGSEPETEEPPRDPLLSRADINQKDAAGKREKRRTKASRLE